MLRFFWPRMTATSLAWMLVNFAFYGHKLNQAAFIATIVPGGGAC